MNIEEKKNTFDGLSVEALKRIDEVSEYNYNYYSYKGHLILGVSDDDTETEWFLIKNDTVRDLIGYSNLSLNNPETIIVTDKIHT